MRVWLGLMGSILWASMLAQPARLIPVAYDAERDAYYVADELVVGLEPRAPTALASEVMLWVGRVRETVAPLGASVLRLDRATDSDSVRELLLALPGVRYVERNYLVFVCNDPMLSQQWGLARIQASQAWAMASPQRTVYIAIIDTGVDANHPDLSQRMRRYNDGSVYGYNTQLNNANTNDYHGHGTHCAGIAAAHANNGVGIAGVAGVAPVQIMPVKVLNDQGFGTMSDVARGITWAANNGAHVLSLSLGGNAGSQQLADAVNYAWNRGCLVVAAAGNNGVPAPFYPAYYENALAVAASDPNDRLTDFSQYGAWVDIAAPGSAILSTVPGNRYEAWSGTSMACPHVAGAAALIWSCAPSLTNQQLRIALENNADPVQPFWFGGIGEGKGRLNLLARLASRSADAEHAHCQPTEPEPDFGDGGRHRARHGRAVAGSRRGRRSRGTAQQQPPISVVRRADYYPAGADHRRFRCQHCRRRRGQCHDYCLIGRRLAHGDAAGRLAVSGAGSLGFARSGRGRSSGDADRAPCCACACRRGAGLAQQRLIASIAARQRACACGSVQRERARRDQLCCPARARDAHGDAQRLARQHGVDYQPACAYRADALAFCCAQWTERDGEGVP
jgi:thermitase